MSIWTDLGFSDNPFDSHPLKPNEQGDALLVGREQEVRKLGSSLRNSSNHPTIEGANGVGKTSLVLVTVYRELKDRLSGNQGATFIPMKETIQMSSDATKMHMNALYSIAQTLIKYESELKKLGHATDKLGGLKKWLNDPVDREISGGIAGVSLGHGLSATGSPGYENSGFEHQLRSALEDIFPSLTSGSIVGVIDNIELVSNSQKAKEVLQSLRDTTLSLPGVKWVLCGALGIIRVAVSSPSLNGRIGTPIDAQPVADTDISALVKARLDYFKIREGARSPIEVSEFRFLYKICNNNLRDALKYAQDFCIWLDAEGEIQDPGFNYKPLLEKWLREEAEKIMRAIHLQPRAWQFFDQLARSGGTCAPGDNEKFGFGTSQQMRTNLAALEEAELVNSTRDEVDKRRKTINITAKGWLVSHVRGSGTQAESVHESSCLNEG
ncbi:MarR family winged helix-turn-helix transcriptional regulator [Corynebacterium falsenii]|uniref:MarR family winged helix-turn-helix transcriptional regulator n=1 Tax=Corynebacterium falsenii TaxID=108486 RepID=UPI00234C8946|nr:MarR family winged helix-turn-helix transcriptional regulator [Corynebacterium falsenii]MDC7104676.1 MarR family winged helix-turn-helix transcriptional regulator [Corynebacterium falsenii]